MALALTTVTNSIAALSVSGVTILDIDQIPPDASAIRAPVMFPEPLNFVSNFRMTRDSFGGGSSAKMTVRYTLTYTFCHHQAGMDRAPFSQYAAMVDKAADILDAILAIDVFSGCVDIVPQAIPEFGPVPDPAGNMYNGCRIQLDIQEFVN